MELSLLRKRLAVFDAERDRFLGPRDAETKLILYLDYACPISKGAYQDIDFEGRTSDVALAFRHYPRPSSGERSVLAAKAALAAAKQGRFWEAQRYLFDNANELSDVIPDRMAAALELDPKRFEDDIASNDVAQRLDWERNEAQARNIITTPSLFIDGERYDGAWDRPAN